jgi:hypothetical protein
MDCALGPTELGCSLSMTAPPEPEINRDLRGRQALLPVPEPLGRLRAAPVVDAGEAEHGLPVLPGVDAEGRPHGLEGRVVVPQRRVMSQGHWPSLTARFGASRLRRHFRTRTNGPKNGSKQRSRSTGAPQGLVAAVAAPRPICEAFLSTMITAAKASRPFWARCQGWARAKIAPRNRPKN